ncbi:hypothetical protein I8F96_14950 [Enterococcus casseliflavus]|nr:hypothetical protein [Enterococcus casseliflavus]
MGKLMFNIYYLNQNKAYELAMLIDNKIYKDTQKEKISQNDFSGSGEIDALGVDKIPFINKFIPAMKLNGDLAHSGTNKIFDNFQIIQTKSTLFNEIVKKSIEKKSLNKVELGSLVKVTNLELEVKNIEETIATKMMLNGVLTNIEVEGFDIGKTFEVLLKDSSYLIHANKNSDKVVFNIPMSVEAELESGYSISDLELGKFTVIGIYRGKFSQNLINDKINQISFISNMDKNNKKSIVESDKDQHSKDDSDKTVEDAHYIDLIGIIQEIKFLK